jgi:hypothetical protein
MRSSDARPRLPASSPSAGEDAPLALAPPGADLSSGRPMAAGRWQLGSWGGWQAVEAEETPPRRGPATFKLPPYDGGGAAGAGGSPGERRAGGGASSAGGARGGGLAGGAPGRAARPVAARAAASAPRPSAAGCSGCRCVQSKCLKLYCVCFAAGGVCGAGCACVDCANKDGDSDEVSPARDTQQHGRDNHPARQRGAVAQSASVRALTRFPPNRDPALLPGFGGARPQRQARGPRRRLRPRRRRRLQVQQEQVLEALLRLLRGAWTAPERDALLAGAHTATAARRLRAAPHRRLPRARPRRVRRLARHAPRSHRSVCVPSDALCPTRFPPPFQAGLGCGDACKCKGCANQAPASGAPLPTGPFVLPSPKGRRGVAAPSAGGSSAAIVAPSAAAGAAAPKSGSASRRRSAPPAPGGPPAKAARLSAVTSPAVVAARPRPSAPPRRLVPSLSPPAPRRVSAPMAGAGSARVRAAAAAQAAAAQAAQAQAASLRPPPPSLLHGVTPLRGGASLRFGGLGGSAAGGVGSLLSPSPGGVLSPGALEALGLDDDLAAFATPGYASPAFAPGAGGGRARGARGTIGGGLGSSLHLPSLAGLYGAPAVPQRTPAGAGATPGYAFTPFASLLNGVADAGAGGLSLPAPPSLFGGAASVSPWPPGGSDDVAAQNALLAMLAASPAPPSATLRRAAPGATPLRARHASFLAPSPAMPHHADIDAAAAAAAAVMPGGPSAMMMLGGGARRALDPSPPSWRKVGVKRIKGTAAGAPVREYFKCSAAACPARMCTDLSPGGGFVFTGAHACGAAPVTPGAALMQQAAAGWPAVAGGMMARGGAPARTPLTPAC